MTIVPSLAWKMDCALAEGPLWVAEEQKLHFVDIRGGAIHCYNPATGTGITVQTGGMPSFIVQCSGGGFLVGSHNGLWRYDGQSMGPQVLSIPEPASNRTNDATVDARGRLWFGTMDNNERVASGAIWCWEGTELTQAGPTAMVTNGPATSNCGRWLYHVDSSSRRIWRHALGDSADLGKGEIFVEIPDGEGFPDGIVVDAEDCLWVALWDGWGVRRYSPEGALLLHVPMPCARPTKIAFGGPDLRTAFVTTAQAGVDTSEQPDAGSLFQFDAPVSGQLCPCVILR